SAIEIPGPEIQRIAQAAGRHGVHVLVGVNERSPTGISTLYNTLVFIGPDGKLLGRHRKLVPAWAEKLTWANGDGASRRADDTAIGPLGGRVCGETTNTLARFSLPAQGEALRVASYLSLPVAPPDYDMAEAIKVRAVAHCFEGKVFTVAACSTIPEEIISAFTKTHPQAEQMLRRKNSAFSGVIGPDGRLVGEPLIDA